MQKEYEYIEEYCEKKGGEIARILSETYDSADFEIDSRKIENEIYDISLSYAKVFFFEERSFLSKENRDQAKSAIRSRFDVKVKKVENMNDIELVANLLKLDVLNALDEHNVTLI